MNTEEKFIRLQKARNTIRDKFVSLGIATKDDQLADLAEAAEGIKNRGAVSVQVKEGEIYDIPDGFHNGEGRVEVVAGEAPPLQTKSVTPTKESQTVQADEDFYGLEQVEVEPIPDEYIQPSGTVQVTSNGEHDVRTAEKVNVLVAAPAPELQEKSVTPSAQSQTVHPDSGFDGLSKVTVAGDAELLPENIKEGVEIFGVLGALAGGGGGGGNSGGDFACGEVIASEDDQIITVQHGLGTIPNMVVWYSVQSLSGLQYKVINCILIPGVYGHYCINGYSGTSSTSYSGSSVPNAGDNYLISNLTYSSFDSPKKLAAGKKYLWIAIA